MTTLVFLLEERSAREMLDGILPRLIPDDMEVQYLVFDGKQDLHKRLEKRLRSWLKPASRFVILRDQDSSDCRALKRDLRDICARAGRTDALVRIACCELESFYLGDLAAVERALGMPNLASQQARRKYREPDMLRNASEDLQRLTAGRYQKLLGSRAIGPYLDLSDAHRSASFRHLVSGIRRLAAEVQ